MSAKHKRRYIFRLNWVQFFRATTVSDSDGAGAPIIHYWMWFGFWNRFECFVYISWHSFSVFFCCCCSMLKSNQPIVITFQFPKYLVMAFHLFSIRILCESDPLISKPMHSLNCQMHNYVSHFVLMTLNRYLLKSINYFAYENN